MARNKNNSKTSVWRILGASLLAVFMIVFFIASVFPTKQKPSKIPTNVTKVQKL